MHDNQAIQMMQRCVEEITSLRGRLAIIEPKAEAYDLLSKVVGFVGDGGISRGHGEDIVWRLKRQIEELTPQPADDAPDPAAIVEMDAAA